MEKVKVWPGRSLVLPERESGAGQALSVGSALLQAMLVRAGKLQDQPVERTYVGGHQDLPI